MVNGVNGRKVREALAKLAREREVAEKVWEVIWLLRDAKKTLKESELLKEAEEAEETLLRIWRKVEDEVEAAEEIVRRYDEWTCEEWWRSEDEEEVKENEVESDL